MAKRFYRLLANRRIRHHDLLKGFYAHAQQLVVQEAPAYVIVALNPVNFEKPYCQKVEGVSTVMKSTPPALEGKKRLTKGYPAMTATVVNLSEPALTYANWPAGSFLTIEYNRLFSHGLWSRRRTNSMGRENAFSSHLLTQPTERI